MKKRKIIIGVIAVIILVVVVISFAIYQIKPISRVEKRLNKEIALNMQEDGQGWEIIIEDLKYKFPDELRGKASLRNVRHNILIVVDKVVLYPQWGSMLKRTQIYAMRGDALGGSFKGDFAVGLRDDFNLYFNKLSSSYIKDLSTGLNVENNTDLLVSGSLNIIQNTVKAQTSIDRIKITLPEPLNMAGDLYFYDGKLDFNVVNDDFTLEQAIIKNDDVQIVVAGQIVSDNGDGHILDLHGVLEVHNALLAKLLNLNQNNGEAQPAFRFSLTGPTVDPVFKFIPPDEIEGGETNGTPESEPLTTENADDSETGLN